MEQTTTATLPSISTEVVKQQMNIELTKINVAFQALTTEKDKLVLNEDHLDDMKAFIQKLKKGADAIADKHTEIKKPYWDTCKNIDAAKNDLTEQLRVLGAPIQTKINEISADIERRRREQAARELKEKQIRSLIQNKAIDFSQKIAACKTVKELTVVESVISLQGTPSMKSVYGELQEEAVKTFAETLKDVIKDQKEKVKLLEDAAKKLEEAETPEAHEALTEAKEHIENQIMDNSVRVQEKVINYSSSFSSPVRAVEVFPEVKAKRTTWKWEIVDIKQLQKKMPHLTKVVPDEEAIDSLMKTKKNDGEFTGKIEVEYNGIRFYEEKKY